MIPAYGYGGSMPDGSVSHCFALNGNPANPEVPGVQGLLDAYHMALSNVGLSGPTNFAQIIHQTGDIVRMNTQNPAQQKYFILLIITDGGITDMGPTMGEIIEAANTLPLSIVIVGVGSSPEFKSMELLDSDEKALTYKDATALRDIVQFVPFNQFVSCPDKLAEETLAEIPRQLVSFMRMRGIAPNPPPAAAGVPPQGAPMPAQPMPAQPVPAQPMPAAAGVPPQVAPDQAVPPQAMPAPQPDAPAPAPAPQ